MRQGTLSFQAAKRTTSKNAKPSVRMPTPTRPKIEDVKYVTTNEIEERSSAFDNGPPELNEADLKWRKHYVEVLKMMGSQPPIHGEGQNKIHEILRVFDLSYEYGPCDGMTRLDRWKRAQALGLEPPSEIYDILTSRQGVEQTDYAQCVFYGQI